MQTQILSEVLQYWRASAAARLLFGGALLFIALFCIGAISLVTGDFAYNWQPVAPGLAGRAFLARAMGLLLMLGSAGVWWARTSKRALLLLSLLLGLWLFVLQGIRLVTSPILAGAWSGMSEIGTFTLAIWLLASRPASGISRGWRLYGLFPCMFGLAHIVFVDITANFVPHWIPHPYFWAYATGVLHLVGGLMILANILPDVAAAGLGVMYLSWVLILHGPRVAGTPGSRFEWTMLLFASAIAGSAFIMSGASSLHDRKVIPNKEN